jgi:hypothetical protein
MYSFSWLCQITLVFSVVWFLISRHPGTDPPVFLEALFFALPLGAGMALLATVGFLLKFAKTRYIGPNPTWTGPPDDHAAA